MESIRQTNFIDYYICRLSITLGGLFLSYVGSFLGNFVKWLDFLEYMKYGKLSYFVARGKNAGCGTRWDDTGSLDFIEGTRTTIPEQLSLKM